eukprot:TRINITY_DN10086_c0_g1_i6.p1 TRINITY_DN10086_c0_g1~~TRINITY_DN10086_c0_g1_i6.p1  ORF type:complete len:201 (+),score=17.82 TRINITY_DN10086_c0_g1_i6:1001-1603(+)
MRKFLAAKKMLTKAMVDSMHPGRFHLSVINLLGWIAARDLVAMSIPSSSTSHVAMLLPCFSLVAADDSKSITSVGSTNSAKTVTSSPLRQRTASSSSLNRSRTGSSVNVGKGNTPEGNTKSIKPEKVNEQLVQLGVDENMAHLCHLIATLSSSPGYASGWRIKPSHRLAKAACISPPTTWLSYAATRKKLEALPIPVSDS